MGNQQVPCQCLDEKQRSFSQQIASTAPTYEISSQNDHVPSEEQYDNPSRKILSGQFLKTSFSASNQLLASSHSLNPDSKFAIQCTQPIRSTHAIEQTTEKENIRRVATYDLIADKIAEESDYLQIQGFGTANLLSDYIVETAKHIHEPISIAVQNFVKTYKEPVSKYYDLLQKVGEGTYGSVFRAQCKKSKQFRAIKLLKKKQMLNKQKQSFLSQMQLLKKLDHPNIIKLYQIFYYNSFYYVVTQYCCGGTIIDFLSKSGKYSEQILKVVMSQIMRALTYIHGEKIVHRDIKLENMVFLNPINPHVSDESTQSDEICLKIIDFGGATTFKYNKNTSNSTFGTTSYMAPQVIQGVFNDKCDVWSTGVILHILLSGRSPFKSRTKEETFHKIKAKKINCIQPQWETVSPEAIDLLKRMLEKDFSKRISAEECLKHAWFNQKVSLNGRQAKKVKTIVLKNLSNYYRENNLVSIIQSYLVFKKISQKERQDLAQLFRRLDKDNNGSIDVQQLLEAYTEYQGNQVTEDRQAIVHIISKIDKNKSGKIDFSQFLAAVYGRKKLFVKDSLSEAFEYLDENKTGVLQKKQLRNTLKGCDKLQIQKIISDLDKNKDEKVSKQEFLQYFMARANSLPPGVVQTKGVKEQEFQ